MNTNEDKSAPLADASLTLVGGPGPPAAPRRSTTDARGRFCFRELPHGTYRVAGGPGIQLEGNVEVTLPVGPTGARLPPIRGTRRNATATNLD